MHQYVKWLLGKQFHEILFNTIETDTNKSVLLIANHYSFWDTLILYHVNSNLLKKNFHVMILEETSLEQVFLRYAGAFSVDKSSRDMLKSLNYASELLNDPKNLVLIYPQGKLYSNFVNEVHFENGVSRIIKQAQGKFQLIFAAAFIQYFKHKKPTATVYLENMNESFADKSIDELQSAYQQYYSASKKLQTEIDIEQ